LKQWLAGCVFVCSDVSIGRKRKTEENQAKYYKAKEKVIAESCVVIFFLGRRVA